MKKTVATALKCDLYAGEEYDVANSLGLSVRTADEAVLNPACTPSFAESEMLTFLN
jgi:hypothetical protein